MKKYFRFFKKLNFKTLYLNFKYLPFKQAVKLPIFISNNAYLKVTSGKLIINGTIKTGLINFGYGNVGIFDNRKSRSIWDVSGTIIFDGKCNIGHGSKISVGKNGKLILGDNFKVTAETTIIAFSEIKIGANCLFSWDILIMDTDFHKIRDENNITINHPEPINIGEKVWIGCRSLILKGTLIPKNYIIKTNSFVSKKLDKSNSLYVGNPCKLVKENISWKP